MNSVPLELVLRSLCPNGQCALWSMTELKDWLMQHPSCGTLFYVEHTTSAKGPYVLYYPMSAWEAEQQRSKEIDALLIKQNEQATIAQNERRQFERARLIEQIGAAKKRGDLDTITELRKELKAL